MNEFHEIRTKLSELSEGDQLVLRTYALGMIEGVMIACDKMGADKEEAFEKIRMIFKAFHEIDKEQRTMKFPN